MTKLRIGISQLFFLLCTISLYAQSNQVISGIIIDQQSKQPLPYANIQILDTFKGTTSNIEGEFEILLDSSSQSLEFSYIGFETKIVKADFFKESIFIELSPKPIAGQVITVYAYNWVERFILKAIENKKYFRKKLLYYKALAYSKKSFNSVDSNKLFAMIEALSNIYYQAPDTYKETVINLQMPPYMKNIPYQALAINQNVDINNERIKVQKFSIISPLNDTALEYYDYKLTEQFFSGTDTVVKISVIPKRSNRALVSGSLFFKKHTYQIIKADLKGNNSVHDGIADSLILFLKYRSDSVFSLPSFTKIKLQMNFMGIPYNYIQENSFIEHSINDPQNKQIINLDQLVNIEPNLNYDIGLKRKKVFGIPLSKDEKEYKETVNRVFVKAPLYKRIILFLFTDLFPLSFDQPASIGNIKISRFSNWYHFNKVESHFLGLEYQLINNDLFNIYSQGGYSFERKKFSYSFINRYKGLTLEVKNQVINIGGFDYNKTGQSLSALFSHKDDMNYYQSTNFVATYNHDLFSKLNAKIDLEFEQQKPLKKTTDFSFFSRNKIYSPNYLIHRYNNNKAGITLNYIENHDYYIKRPILYHGESFTNLSISYYYQNERMLKATEDRAILNLKLHRFQPIIYPMSVDFKLIWHKQDKSDYNQMSNFTSKMNSFFEFESDLSFYSLDNYEYYINDYLKLHNDVTLFNFPEIYNVKMSFGGLVSYLKPLRTTKFDTEFFKVLEKEFWEYGIVIKGISIFNLYLITNNFQNNVVNFQLKMYL